MTVPEAIALCGACVWGPALFLALAPAWLWTALAGAVGLAAGLLAGWACGWLLCRSDGASLGTQLLAAGSLFALVGVPLAALWVVRFAM